MRYVDSTFRSEQDELAYRIYVSESLRLSAQNQALTEKYIDLIRPRKIDTRSADEIALGTIKNLGLTVGGKE